MKKFGKPLHTPNLINKVAMKCKQLTFDKVN